MQQITNHVYVESNFQGCNTGFVDIRQGIAVIDTPMVPVEANKYKNLIDEFGEVVYVINSEPHPDHVSGNCWFGGTVIASV